MVSLLCVAAALAGGLAMADEAQAAGRDDHADDFQFVSTTGGTFSATDSQGAPTIASILGAPGPQHTDSPLQPLTGLTVVLLDAGTTGAPLTTNDAPNRVRVMGNQGTNQPSGYILVRRHITNRSGAPLTRLRFRAARVTTLGNSTSARADLRLLSSTDESSVSTSRGAEPVFGTILEETDLTQGMGGGVNSSAVDGTRTLDTPLPDGQSRNYSFKLGVVRVGSFALTLTVEGLN